MSNLAESPITMAGKILQQDTRAGIKGAIISAENETLGKEIRQSTKDDGAYTFLLEPGRWKISITCPGYVSPDAKDDVFSTDVQQTDVLLSPGVGVNGTVFWLGTREHVSGAVIKPS